MLLFYIRHGVPTYDPDCLTPLGHEQARAIAKRLCSCGIDKIYASSSTRAYQTAQPTADLMRKEITALDWCHENLVWKEFGVNYEDGHWGWCYFHQPTKELFVSDEIKALGKKWYEHPAFSTRECYRGSRFKEGVERVQKQADDFLLSLGYRHDRDRNGYIAEAPNDDRVALFAHEGFSMAFLSSILDIPYPDFCTHHGLSHTGMCVIEFKNVDGLVIPKVLQHSNDSHLYAERLPMMYENRLQF